MSRLLRCAAVVLAIGSSVVVGAVGSFRVDAARSVAGPVSSNPFRQARTLVIPHGGGDALFPENTIVAYVGSRAMGGEVIDADVQMSRDGVLVAFHDPTLERTTNGTGRVDSKTLAELEKLDAGWAFTRRSKHPYRGKGIRIPTIEAILRRFPKMPVTLDVKDERTELVRPLCDVLIRLGRTADVYLGLDSSDQVIGMRNTCPGVRTSGTDDDRRAMRAARERSDAAFVPNMSVSQPRFRADDGSIRITEAYLSYAHSKGIAVLTWVVDDPKDMRYLLDLGVDGIYTRRPDVLVKLRDG